TGVGSFMRHRGLRHRLRVIPFVSVSIVIFVFSLISLEFSVPDTNDRRGRGDETLKSQDNSETEVSEGETILLDFACVLEQPACRQLWEPRRPSAIGIVR